MKLKARNSLVYVKIKKESNAIDYGLYSIYQTKNVMNGASITFDRNDDFRLESPKSKYKDLNEFSQIHILSKQIPSHS